MSSAALSVYPHLPPTTNFLNSQQRTRLVRSTRKLGSVLGTTPFLLENDVPFTILPLGKGKTTPKVLKRQGSIFTHKQPSSLSITSNSTASSPFASPAPSSINFSRSTTPSTTPSTQSAESLINPPGLSTAAQKCRPRNKPPQLCLQLNSAPLTPVNDCFASYLSVSPSSPLFPSPCPSPLTPTTPIFDPTEIGRKRMAKLARHLGEKIPVELVLTDGASSLAPVSRNRQPRSRSQSIHHPPGAARTRDDQPPSHSKQEWVGEWNRSSIRDVQNELRGLKLR